LRTSYKQKNKLKEFKEKLMKWKNKRTTRCGKTHRTRILDQT
jgi:hypothetical protein